MRIYKGDIFYADLTPVVGCEQGGIRPILIVQNDIGNRYSPTVIVAAITSRTEKSHLPTHIRLCSQQYGLRQNSLVLLEQVRTIDRPGLQAVLEAAKAGSFQVLLVDSVSRIGRIWQRPSTLFKQSTAAGSAFTPPWREKSRCLISPCRRSNWGRKAFYDKHFSGKRSPLFNGAQLPHLSSGAGKNQPCGISDCRRICGRKVQAEAPDYLVDFVIAMSASMW